MTHICVDNWTIIGSVNGLSPGRRQVIIWTNNGILLIWPLKTNFSEILGEIHTFSFEKMRLKMSSAKWRQCCPGLNVLRCPGDAKSQCNQQQPKYCSSSLQWRHNGLDSVSHHQPHDCFLNRLFKRRSKKTSKLRVTGLCAGNSPEAGEFPVQMASSAEKVYICLRHHAVRPFSFHEVVTISHWHSPCHNNRVSAMEMLN